MRNKHFEIPNPNGFGVTINLFDEFVHDLEEMLSTDLSAVEIQLSDLIDKYLDMKNVKTKQAYNEGYDEGYEDGYEEGRGYCSCDGW